MTGFVLALASASLAQEVTAEQAAGRVVEAESVDADSSVAAIGVPDMTFCQLYDLKQFGRVGDVVGLALATTSWNIGTADLMWFASPDPRHPFIVQNLYRTELGRFEQIGQSWIKHGFFALDSEQCGVPCTYEDGHGEGPWLGVGCTDTYSSSLNANTFVLGPREEVNPWTAEWTFTGSHLSASHSHDGVEGIDHRLQVHDDDLDSALHPTAQYFAEGFYIVGDDLDVMNNASWKPVTVTGTPGGTWTFGMSGESSAPTIGFAIDAWEGASQAIMAEEIPVSEMESPDGRTVLASKATDLGGGMWHYEYAMLNIDLSRKGCGFSVPIDPDTTVTNIGFHAPESHGESYSNTPWTMEVSDSCPGGGQCVRWSTTDNNPLRWGTLYNFRFDADVGPAGGVVAGAATPASTVTLGLCEPGGPMTLSATAIGPIGPGTIPTVSQWGIVVMALLLATAASVLITRRRIVCSA